MRCLKRLRKTNKWYNQRNKIKKLKERMEKDKTLLNKFASECITRTGGYITKVSDEDIILSQSNQDWNFLHSE